MFYYFLYTSSEACATRTCDIFKLQNMDEDRCYMQLHFFIVYWLVKQQLLPAELDNNTYEIKYLDLLTQTLSLSITGNTFLSYITWIT
jgi:hypothetical protein